MEIVKKEALNFSDSEKEALQVVLTLCSEIEREASDSDLKKLACETYNKICDLWGRRK